MTEQSTGDRRLCPTRPTGGLNSGMPSAEEYRANAEQCFALAQKATDPDDRARLIQMAQSWRELADRFEARKSKKE
jgi:hypothetical protein